MKSASGRRHHTLLSFLIALAIAATLIAVPIREASALPAGFSESTVFRGLANPTVLKFSADGRIFVAEKSGRIKVFDSLNGHNGHYGGQPCYAGSQLLGSRTARDGASSELSDHTLHLCAVHRRCGHWRHRAPVGNSRHYHRIHVPRLPDQPGHGCVVSSRLFALLEISGDAMAAPRSGMID